MARITKVEGMQEVKRNVRGATRSMGRGVSVGLRRAGLTLQAMSQRIVPVQTGNLKASAFTRHSGGGFDTVVTVGYTAAYAVFVHENLEAAHGEEFNRKHADKIRMASTRAQRKVWFRRGPNQQAKFLERPMRENKRKLLEIVKREMHL